MIFIRGQKERELTTRDGVMSSMRYSMLVILELIVISVIGMMAIFIYEAIQCNDISFKDAGFFLGGLAGLWGVAAGSKAVQKRNEIKPNKL